MKYYIISGEKSGDLYGGYLIKSLAKYHNKNANFICWGGDNMKKNNGEMVRSLDKLSFMGFWEVLKNFRTVIYNFQLIKRELKNKKPDILILIDYPGFNLRVAQYAKSKKIKVIWFVAPQVWAWNEKRVSKLKKNVDRMYVILPFEEEYFKSKNVNVQFFGHPLTQLIKKRKIKISSSKKIIALFPGSRAQEIKKTLPIMLGVIKYFNDYSFIIGGVKNIDLKLYKRIIGNHNVKLVIDQTYKLMNLSSAAILTSGTVSLEAALFGVPQVVCYKTSFISYLIAKKYVKTKFISLVNIISNKKVVDELIQDDFNLENLIISLEKSLNKNYIKKLNMEYNKISNSLNKKFSFDNMAKDIIKFYNN